MDNNKESILQQVNASCKDILSFLADKYGLSRSEVKQAVFFYAYNSELILNPDSLKFAEPNTDYQNLINDYIEYTKLYMEARRNTVLSRIAQVEQICVSQRKEAADKFHAFANSIDKTLKRLFGEENAVRNTSENNGHNS